MSDIAIRVHNIGKMYRIGTAEKQPQNLWQATKTLLASPFDYLRRISRPPTAEETLWAIKEISFEVKCGEVIGIIGRNGAGKSTLLKILSRITEPTEGRIEINGRVGSLLEVGTGFHPELTGRENIYLNGAILGMKKREIERKFDEIVAFSEVEQFLDTPVKRYSSGMYVRLAFSVAAHLEPDILLIDEVLSVGDLAFREKCFRHISTLRESGVTIVVVSHYLAQVSVLTRRCIWLDYGKIRQLGGTDEVLSAYANELRLEGDNSSSMRAKGEQESSGQIEYAAVRTVDSNGNPCDCFEMGQDIIFEFEVHVHEPVRQPRFGMSIYTHDRVKVLIQNTLLQGHLLPDLVDRDGTIRLCLPTPPFLAGDYTVWAGIGMAGSNSATFASWPDCHAFSILVPNMPNANHFVYTEPLNGTGMMRWDGEWQLPWV